ncbi:Fur family transcriptional regulator [Streptosporangium sandarakinum]|uniref:Fur family transcriptional regulator n=1 Tax=Streptosporangium sandarakinum TaxID=1260955 RepID=UPI0036756256
MSKSFWPEKGLRRTGPRMVILSVLEQVATHVSVPGLVRLTMSVQPTISPSTVYRNVAAMTDAGVLHSVDYAGETLYGLSMTAHHHLICERCGLLWELPAEEFDPVVAHLTARRGFDLSLAGQVLHGRCRRCAIRPLPPVRPGAGAG